MNNNLKISQKLNNVDAIYLSCEANRFYASGFFTPGNDGAMLITDEKSYYLTDFRYIEAAKKLISDSEVICVDSKKGYVSWLKELSGKHNIRKLGIDDEYITYSQYAKYENALSVELVPSSNILSELRAQKNFDEIEYMIKAQRIAESALNEVKNHIKVGVKERDISSLLLYEMLKRGAEDKSFDPIVLSGKNTSMPHGTPSDKEFEAGDFITIDFGCKYNGYCSDMTRTFALSYATDQMQEIYNIVLEAQLEGIKNIKAGITGCDADSYARSVIEKAGYGDFFGHSFGHGLGIEIHESPNLSPSNKLSIPENAVVSAEPGIYIPNKFGVRIEDVVIVKENNCVNITNYPKNLEIL